MAGVGEVGTTLLVEIAKRAIPPAVDATVRQFVYLFNYKSNINNLKGSAAELIITRLDAESYWDSIGDNNEEATHTNTAWLVKVKDAEGAAKDIKDAAEKPKTGCLSKWCPNPKERYQLSKAAVKKTEEIQELKIQGKDYVPKTKLAPPPSKQTGAQANHGSKDFKTRAKIMDKVIEALKDDKVIIIGVCGSGGVGKTTLMHELRERAKVNDLFNEVVMVTVSQNPDLSNIRCKLAEMLGLKRVKDGKNEIATADELHTRLTQESRKTLVILDDIWSDIDLEELGIPIGSDQKKCKVVLTSRQEGVCNQMKAQITIPVAVMPPDESWYLFRKTAGDCVESDDLIYIAKEVADECGGLPVALVTLARTLSNQKIKIWRDALSQLRKHSVTRIPEMDRKVYSSIKMSYDFLAVELPEAKALLLLCCQHPEDALIEVERLAMYCLVLHLLKNVDSLEDARNSVSSLIERLKSFFLLEETDVHDAYKNHGYGMVKMHDIVRDVGLSIVSRVKEERDGVHMQMGTSEDCPNSRFLSRMEELRVVDYSSVEVLVQLPAVEVLTNLRMLSLEKAEFNEDTGSKIVRLTKLEILSFLNCTNRMGSFPSQIIGQLRNLKLLDLRFVVEDSQPIPSGILPELNKLEDLYLGKYYFWETPVESEGEDGEGGDGEGGDGEWGDGEGEDGEGEDGEGENGEGDSSEGEDGEEGESSGRITELEMLSNLTTLQIELLNPTELLHLEQFCFEKLQRFSFRKLGGETNIYNYRWSTFWRTLEFEHVSMGSILRKKFQSILRRTEQLELRNIDDWTDSAIIRQLVSVRELKLDSCEHLEYLIYDGAAHEGEGTTRVGAFPNLETLTLCSMSDMKELCHNGNLPVGSFGNLREVCIDTCGALQCIFPHSAAKCLVQLEKLYLNRCSSVKEIVSKRRAGRGKEITEESTDLIVHFPKLRLVSLFGLNDLQGFYNHDDNSRVQPLLTPLVMLPRMETLEVLGLNQLKQIVGAGSIDIPNFAASDWLQNFAELEVYDCSSLESVFDFDGQQFMAENTNVVILGKLEEIILEDLPNLTHIFCCRRQDISVPKLRVITVKNCAKLGYLFASNLIKLLKNLKEIKIENCELLEAVFDFEESEVMTEDAHAVLSELEDVDLKCLRRLEHVCRMAPTNIHVFQNLLFLNVEDCGSLGYLFTTSVAQMLVNLRGLTIWSCSSMKECIRTDDVYREKKIVFSSLDYLSLGNMENLLSFCSSDQQVFEFPSLEEVSISDCPGMKIFCYGRLTEEVEFTSDVKLVWKSDLNQTIVHFDSSEPEEKDVGDKIKDAEYNYADEYDDDSEDFDDSADDDDHSEDFDDSAAAAVADDDEAEDVRAVDNIDGSDAAYQVDENAAYQVGDNEGTSSKPTKTFTAPLAEPSSDASLAPFVVSTSSLEGHIESSYSKEVDSAADTDENAQRNYEVTYSKAKEGLLAPTIAPSPSSTSENNKGLPYSTSPGLNDSVSSASNEQSLPSSLMNRDMKEVDSAAAEDNDDETVVNNINVSKDGDENVQSNNEVLNRGRISNLEVVTSEDMDDCGLSNSSNSFVEYREFRIIVNGGIIDSELSKHFQAKYYKLCCSRKCYLHQRLHKGINHTLAAEIISQTIDIADAIKASKLSTCLDQFATWDNTLEAFELLGMDVGFLRAHLNRLVSLAHRSTEEVRNLELKLLELNEAKSRLEKEMESLKENAKRYEIMFQEEAKNL